MSEEREAIAKIAADWREALSFIESVQKRANYEFTSKTELRGIAQAALGQLHGMYSAAVKRAEEAAATSEPSSIIVAPGSDQLLTPETPGGLVSL